MSDRTAQLSAQAIDVGDQVHIQQGSRALRSDLVGQSGTVVEVFRVPQDSCLVRIAGDRAHQREWFFYRDEVTTSDTPDQSHSAQAAALWHTT
jgi:hypothetical protein